MIALIDQRIIREDVEPFVQEIEIYVGEGKELSEGEKILKGRPHYLPRCPSLSYLESQEDSESFPRRFSLQGPVRLPQPLPQPPPFLPLEGTFELSSVDIAFKNWVPLTGCRIPVVYLRFVSRGFAQVLESPPKKISTNFEPSKR